MIIEPSGYDTPCFIRLPRYGELQAHLDNDKQFEMLCRRYWKIYGKLLQLDWTPSINT